VIGACSFESRERLAAAAGACENLLERPACRIGGAEARLKEIGQPLITLLEPGEDAREVVDTRAAERRQRVTTGSSTAVGLQCGGAGIRHRARMCALECELIADELDLVHGGPINDLS